MRKSSWKQEKPGWRAGNQTTSFSLITGIISLFEIWRPQRLPASGNLTCWCGCNLRRTVICILWKLVFEERDALRTRCGCVVDKVRIGCGCAAVGTEVWRTSWIRPARSHQRFHTQAPAENFSFLYSWDSRILAGCAGQISPCLLCNSPLCPPKKLFFSPLVGHVEHTLPVSGVKNHPDFFFSQKLPCAFIPTFFPLLLAVFLSLVGYGNTVG